MAFEVFLAGCIASWLVPLLAGAPPPVSTLRLLAILPVAYAGLRVSMGVIACMWLFGWRPQSRA